MKVRGREIGFLKTVKTVIDLAEICPEKDIKRIEEAFSGNFGDIQKNAAILIHSLNESYEMSKHFDDLSYEPKVLSVDEILYLKQGEFQDLLEEAVRAYKQVEQTVEVEAPKKKKKEEV